MRYLLLPILLLPAVTCSWSQSVDSMQRRPVIAKPVLPDHGSASWNTPPRPASIPYDYYNSLGAACKAELKLEKATHVPLRIRLGSLAQTDYLEQKPNAARPEKP